MQNWGLMEGALTRGGCPWSATDYLDPPIFTTMEVKSSKVVKMLLPNTSQTHKEAIFTLEGHRHLKAEQLSIVAGQAITRALEDGQGDKTLLHLFI
jgi:hypothetical protein